LQIAYSTQLTVTKFVKRPIYTSSRAKCWEGKQVRVHYRRLPATLCHSISNHVTTDICTRCDKRVQMMAIRCDWSKVHVASDFVRHLLWLIGDNVVVVLDKFELDDGKMSRLHASNTPTSVSPPWHSQYRSFSIHANLNLYFFLCRHVCNLRSLKFTFTRFETNPQSARNLGLIRDPGNSIDSTTPATLPLAFHSPAAQLSLYGAVVIESFLVHIRLSYI
jgi:hypothetical protein